MQYILQSIGLRLTRIRFLGQANQSTALSIPSESINVKPQMLKASDWLMPASFKLESRPL